MEFTKSQEAAKTIEKWRKLAVDSSVVPQQPQQLRAGEGEGERRKTPKLIFFF